MATTEIHVIDSDKRVKNNSFCLGCGSPIKSYSILICTECLDDECNKFAKFAEFEEEENNDSTYEEQL